MEDELKKQLEAIEVAIRFTGLQLQKLNRRLSKQSRAAELRVQTDNGADVPLPKDGTSDQNKPD